ncbi:MAG: hypothetical protein HW405_379 [Candidatus Berkelbacteria bacterium]|nr:hypothetical protein [Candidatus Berkelbacteria bacterium]
MKVTVVNVGELTGRICPSCQASLPPEIGGFCPCCKGFYFNMVIEPDQNPKEAVQDYIKKRDPDVLALDMMFLWERLVMTTYIGYFKFPPDALIGNEDPEDPIEPPAEVPSYTWALVECTLPTAISPLDEPSKKAELSA